MTPSRADRPLVILGPTASGKSDLALAVAGMVGEVEIVSVDSMQVYRGMDIGTAKPTAAQQAAVPHHLIDLVDAGEEFAVGEFQRLARVALAGIRRRGRIPLLVGGTGLYLRAVIDDLVIPDRYPTVRAELERQPDTAALHHRLNALDPVAAARMEPTNRRRVLRALEVTVGSGRPFSSFGPGMEMYPSTPFVQVGLRWPRAVLDERIQRRYEAQLEQGFLDEVRSLAATGASTTAAQALGYRELLGHLEGRSTIDEAVHEAVLRTRRFARRQERWFRRDPRVHWVDMPVEPDSVVALWDADLANEGA